MRRVSELYPGEAKTDRRDSSVPANTARTHVRRLHWLELGDETLERLRVLGGYDDDLAHDVNRTANRLRDMLLALSPALERVLGPGSTTPPPGAACPLPTPTALRARGTAPAHAARKAPPTADGRPAGRRDPGRARRPESHRPRGEPAGRVIRELAEELDRLAARRDRLAHEIEQTFTSHPQAPVLMSIQGIGARTGARILTEIGDINRFPTSGHLAATPASPPSPANSGRSLNGETRGRRGNHRLKNAMWLSAFCSLHHDRSRDYYPSKRSQGRLHNAAITASPAAAATSSTPCCAPASATTNYPGRHDRPPSRRSHSPPEHRLMP